MSKKKHHLEIIYRSGEREENEAKEERTIQERKKDLQVGIYRERIKYERVKSSIYKLNPPHQ